MNSVMDGLNSLEDDPSEAVQSVKLGQATGYPAEWVHSNREDVLRQHKADLARQIITSSPTLQKYIRDNPLAAKVSNDDWGQLGKLGGALDKFSRNFLEHNLKIMEAGAKGWEDWYGDQYPLSGFYGNKYGMFDPAPSYKGETALDRALWSALAFAPEQFIRLSMGAIGEISGVSGELLRQAGLSEGPAIADTAAKIATDPVVQAYLETSGIPTMAAAAFMLRGFGASMEASRAAQRAGAAPHPVATRIFDSIRPFVKAKEVPPVGSGFDDLWKKRSEVAEQRMEDVQKAASETNTIQPNRMPDYVQNIIRDHPNGGDNIGVNWKFIQELYGDKVPTEDDGKLGWVPDLQEKFDWAKRHNSDVWVSLDGLVKARTENPEFSQAIKDHIRVEYNGFNPAERKALVKPEEPKEETFYERPQEGEQKLEPKAPPQFTIKELPQGSLDWSDVAFDDKSLVYDIMEGGKEVGSAVGHIDGDTLHIDRITAHGPGKEMRFGPLALRQLWEQFAETHPEINKVAGFRVSGARTVAGTGASQALQSVKKVWGLPEAPKGWSVAEGHPVEGLIHPDATPNGPPIDLADKGSVTPTWTMSLHDAISMINEEDLNKLSPKGTPERIVYDFFANRLQRIAGDVPVHIIAPEELERVGRDPSRAFYSHYAHAIFSTEAMAQPFVFVHEGAHALTSRAIFMYPELGDAAQAMANEAYNWWQKNRPEDLRYPLADPGVEYAFKNVQEFLAQSFSSGKVRETLSEIPASKELMEKVKGTYGKNPTLWDIFKNFVKMALAKITGVELQPRMLHALVEFEQRVEKVYPKAAEGVPDYLKEPKEPQAPEDIPKIGLTEGRRKAWQRAVDEDAKAEREWIEKQAKKVSEEVASKEWKDNLATTRQEVAERLRGRPDMMLDEAMRQGTMGGKELDYPIRIGKDSVTAEERKGLPEGYFSSRGQSADEIAANFGFGTRNEMLDSLRALEQQRQLEGLTPQAHFTKILDAMADRAMRDKFGSVEDQAVKAAEDHVFGPTTLNKHAEEIYAKSLAYGDTLPWNDAEVRLLNKTALQNQTLSDLSVGKLRRDAEKNGREAVDLARDGKNIESLRRQQAQFNNLDVAAQVKKLNERKEKVENLIGRYQVSDKKGILLSDLLMMHELMRNGGASIPRSAAQQADALRLAGPKRGDNPMTFREYVTDVDSQHGIYNHDPDAAPIQKRLNVDEMYLDPPPEVGDRHNYKLDLSTMTVAQFEKFADALESMDKHIRKSGKVDVKGELRDLNETVSGLIDRLKAAMKDKPLPERVMGVKNPQLLRWLGSLLLTPESWFNRLDLGNKRGAFSQTILRPIMEGQYDLRTMERAFAKRWKSELGEYPDFNRPIKNELFKDSEGQYVQMTKENAYAILQNMGNNLQRRKLVGGWEIPEMNDAMSADDREAAITVAQNKVWEWLFRPIEQGGGGMVKEDLKRAQRMGKIYNDAFERAQLTYSRLGKAPSKIDLGKVLTPYNEMEEEWYAPLIKDPLRTKEMVTADQIAGEGGGYFRPSPAQGYTKGRTGALYRIDLHMDGFGPKLKQILTDAAMREQIAEVSKIIYHKDFQDAFRKYFGADYFSGIDKWLKDVAGNREWNPRNMNRFNRGLLAANRNLSTLYVGMNPGTFMKHVPSALVQSIGETGPELLTTFGKMMWQLPGSREIWNFAHESSEELQNRFRSSSESISGVDEHLFSSPGRRGYVKWREGIERLSHWPVAMGDLIFSTAQWATEYAKQARLNPELEHGDLVYLANTAVRRTHGSSMLASKAQITRSNPVISSAVPLYNFMSSAMQRLYSAGWMAKLVAERGVGRGDVTLPEMADFAEEKLPAFKEALPKIMGPVITSGIFLALIHQMVDPLERRPDEGPMSYWSKVMVSPYLSMIPFVGRDIVLQYMQGHDEGLGGLFASTAKDIGTTLNLRNIRTNPGKWLRSTNRVFGLLTGLTLDKPIGTTIQYLGNVMAGREIAPKPADFLKGLAPMIPRGITEDYGGGGPFWRGTSKPPRRH